MGFIVNKGKNHGTWERPLFIVHDAEPDGRCHVGRIKKREVIDRDTFLRRRGEDLMSCWYCIDD